MHSQLSVTRLVLAGLFTAALASWFVTGAAADETRVVHIVVQNDKFVIKPEDQDITVKSGQEIKWLDEVTLPTGGHAPHELGPTGGEDPFPGTGEFEHELTTNFTTPGVIEYDCKRHGTMKGKITITEAKPPK